MSGRAPHERGREVVIETADADATRDLGARLAALLRAGDLVVLSGALGAGKTTLAQGVGAAMGGRVSSPTFTIARVHPAPAGGPDLIHVDAYRLGSLEEVDALDLDSSMGESVTLVEWGRGKVEALSENRLEITVDRPRGGLSGDGAPAARPGSAAVADLAEADDSRRTVTVAATGPRWADVDLSRLKA